MLSAEQEKDAIMQNLIDKSLEYFNENTETKSQLEMGIEVEKEHKDVWDLLKKFADDNKVTLPLTEEEFYKKIAEAHLKEISDYYTRLDKMEKSK